MAIVIKRKTEAEAAATATEAVNAILKMSDAEFAAMRARERERWADSIDRPTTAEMLGIKLRTLDRWNDQNYGPKRYREIRRPLYYYSRVEVQAWIAKHGRGTHRPRS